ncbi:uncharacterized protein LOC116416644 [Nasonia vitripennis]|uniref:Uncharacterized protein n=1 Tax=Nasonia vitripennis TaxID=7425 RepID=A0A7M7Q6C8_NASVI|nr:uncharacterized protein LOC116416644 [Nasonia vitripennis]XP_031781555.1 uncharacterized protein LOC116416644 [Nasonia vitripennis]
MMSNEQTRPYKVSKDSVKKAMELFNNVKKTTKRKKSPENEDDSNKHSQFCNPIIGSSKKNLTALAFSPSFALREMRLCLMKHDWVNLQRLFPLLLELSSDKETLVWRYALTILLHSPMSSGAHVENFLNSCVGCQNDNLNYVLDQLITLRVSKQKNS